MLVPGANAASLRLDPREASRLAWAFALSIAVHLLAWGVYTEGRRLHVWEHVHLPAWIQTVTQSLASVVNKKPPPETIDREAPVMFVDVSPHQATTEPPKNAAFYSDKNSQAANPDANKDSTVPKITGEQTQVAKTEDVPRNRFDKLQPSAPAPNVQPAEPAKPKPVVSPGDLTLARPELNPREDTGTAEQPRPRTIKEALARQPPSRLAGQKMKQEGGVRRVALVPSFDVKETPFGSYDAAFIEAVQQCWYDALERIHYDGARQGKVVLQFHLNYDGRISEMTVVESTVGETLTLLCRRAVATPAPYDKWPRQMRQIVGQDYRQIQFTFYYN